MSTPKTPENVFVLKFNNFTLIKWDPVTKDTEGNDITVNAYRIYYYPVSEEPNKDKFYLVSSKDHEEKVHTIILIENAPDQYYKVSAILDNEESAFSKEVTVEPSYNIIKT